MASKLYSQYGFSKDNLKVLLGGWNTWKSNNGTDPNGYPIETTAATTPGANGAPGVIIITPAANPSPAGTPLP